MKSALYDVFGDLVIYRNLNPSDPRLPRFAEIWEPIGLAGPLPPRKLEPAYAQVLTWFLNRARALDAPDLLLEELVFIGDTFLNDGTAFRNLRAAGNWRGWAFIGAERDEELAIAEKDGVYTANRWAALAGFVTWVLGQGAALDRRTAVIVDIDKTAIGARGRNDGVIDRARVIAIEATAAETLGSSFDQESFRQAYAVLNQAKYHPFTADNQDYLAYICLMLSAGALTLDALLNDLASGCVNSFYDFINWIEGNRLRALSPALRNLHADIYARVCAGDVTPFKAFRRREYRETLARMGSLPDEASPAQRLVEEICLTREVLDVAGWLRTRGCLMMALSDKPDEAALPPAEEAARGDLLPLHRMATHVVGQSIVTLLPEAGR